MMREEDGRRRLQTEAHGTGEGLVGELGSDESPRGVVDAKRRAAV